MDCTASGLSREEKVSFFSKKRITLQSLLFCQQVFSAAVIVRIELRNLSDDKKNQLIPVPHPEFIEDWPSTLALSLENLLILHRIIPF